MRQRDDAQRVVRDLVHDAVGKFARKVASPVAATDGAELRRRQDQFDGAFEFIRECACHAGVRVC
jgi:hypothetical protein